MRGQGVDTLQSSAGERVIASVFERVLANPTKPALADRGRRLNYGELGASMVTGAAKLLAQGVRPGDRVVVAAANSVAEAVTHLAVLTAGATVVPLGKVPAERLSFVVSDSGARLVCVDDVAGDLGVEPHVAVLHVNDIAGELADGTECVSAPQQQGDSLASLMYTTGSTGLPKGVMIGHRELTAALSHIIEYVGFDSADRELIVLPLSHSFGMGQLYCTLVAGGFAWVNEGLRPLKLVLESFRENEITAFATTPSMLRLLLGTYRRPFLDNARYLKRMVVNSEPLPPEQAAELLGTFPSLDLIVYYGLTEASRSTFLRPRQEPRERFRTVGRAAPRVEIQTCDDDGRPTTAGSEGEVCIRGPHLAEGYWHRPLEQAAAFRDGWLRTGDLGILDRDGYLTITGRLKDQINVGGLKVSAAEVEKVIRQHPAVADVAVTGVPDSDGLRGECVAAAIVARDTGLELREIAAFCAQRLEAAAQPQQLMLLDAIPRAETGKVLKGELRKLFEERK
jgi:long-chain acyl-CoA synthetase